MKKLLLTLSASCILVLTGCGNNTETKTEVASEQVENNFYENKDKGIIVVEANGWQLIEEKEQNIVFKNGELTAIITTVKTDDLESIKRDLKVGAGDITIIEETETTLSFQSNKTESIRTDITITQVGDQSQIVSFMTKLVDYEANKSLMDEFQTQIKFN